MLPAAVLKVYWHLHKAKMKNFPQKSNLQSFFGEFWRADFIFVTINKELFCAKYDFPQSSMDEMNRSPWSLAVSVLLVVGLTLCCAVW